MYEEQNNASQSTGQVEQKQPPHPMDEGETAYCITIGNRDIYGVTHQQLQELYQTIEKFIEREKAPFQCQTESETEQGIYISKNIDLCAGDDHFSIDYSLNASDSDWCCLSAAQMQKMVDTISGFLKTFGENGDKNVRWDIADYPPDKQSRITFQINEHNKHPPCSAAPWISKCISSNENEQTEISYFIDINEIHSPHLSFAEFVTVYRKLGHFLKKPE